MGKLKAILATHGIDSTKYAAHSFRRGGATAAHAAGASEALIKALGDWRSNAYLRYIEIDKEVRTIAANKLAEAIHGRK